MEICPSHDNRAGFRTVEIVFTQTEFVEKQTVILWDVHASDVAARVELVARVLMSTMKFYL